MTTPSQEPGKERLGSGKELTISDPLPEAEGTRNR